MFLRKSRLERDPLAVTMSGVRLGERALQIGEGDGRVTALIAARTGLTGRAVVIVVDDDAATRVRRAIDDAGALAEVAVVDQGPRAEDGSFDVIVVHDVARTIASPDNTIRSGWLQLSLRLLRGGGRIVTVERGSPVGLRAWFGSSDRAHAAIESEAALTSAGYVRVRLLGDREGLRFVEGFKKPD